MCVCACVRVCVCVSEAESERASLRHLPVLLHVTASAPPHRLPVLHCQCFSASLPVLFCVDSGAWSAGIVWWRGVGRGNMGLGGGCLWSVIRSPDFLFRPGVPPHPLNHTRWGVGLGGIGWGGVGTAFVCDSTPNFRFHPAVHPRTHGTGWGLGGAGRGQHSCATRCPIF